MKDDDTLVTTVQRLAAAQGTRKRGRAFLTVLSGRDVGRVHHLALGDSVIGRSADAEICIIDDGVSRRHAKIARAADGTAKIVDLASTNGTYVNGRRVEVEVLREGDRIRIGLSATLDFRYEYSEEAEPPRRTSVDSVDERVRAVKHFDEALEAYRRTLQIRESTYGPEHPSVAAVLDTMGTALRTIGSHEEALQCHRRALSIYEGLGRTGPTPADLAHVLTNMGRTQLAMGLSAEALGTQERALRLLEGRRASDGELAAVRFEVAKSLTALGQEPLRARSLAQLAREGYMQTSGGVDQIAAIDAWLAELGD